MGTQLKAPVTTAMGSKAHISISIHNGGNVEGTRWVASTGQPGYYVCGEGATPAEAAEDLTRNFNEKMRRKDVLREIFPNIEVESLK